MPLDKQGPSFLAARLSNETSGRGRRKDPKEYFEGERSSGSNPSGFAALCRRNKLLVLLGLGGFRLALAIIASVVLDEFVNAPRKNGGDTEDPENSLISFSTVIHENDERRRLKWF